MDRTVYNEIERQGFYVENSTKTPGFHRLRARGAPLPSHDYYWYRRDNKSPSSSTYNGRKTEIDVGLIPKLLDVVTSGTFPARGLTSSIDTIDDIKSITRNRLLGKIRDTQIDLGVSLGEYRETAAFVALAAAKVAESARLFKRGHVEKAVRTLRGVKRNPAILRILTGRRNHRWTDLPAAAADAQLTMAFAVRPLLRDVYDACALLEKGYVSTEAQPITVRSGHSTSIATPNLKSGFYGMRVNADIRVQGQVTYWVNNPLLRTLDQCGVLNPLSVAWEITPFSFVLDWFLPIGEFIQNVLPPQGVTFSDGYIYTKLYGSLRLFTDISDAGGEWHTSCTSEEVLKHREMLSDFPTYHAVVPDVSLSKNQVASSMALIYKLKFEGLKSPILRK